MQDKTTGTKGERGHLRVLEGGMADNPTGTSPLAEKKAGKVGKAESGLTLKQEAFAQGLADGLTNAEAYRRAYKADGMKPAILYSEACKQAQHPKVAARVRDLMAEKRAGKQHVSERVNDRVWRGVWKLAESDDVPPAVRASALSLAAKMAGMLTDKVEIKQESSPAAIEQELKARLAKLGIG